MSTPCKRLLTLTLSALLLTACAGPRRPQQGQQPHGPSQDAGAAEQRAQALAARGYPGAIQAVPPQPVDVAAQQWVVKGEPLPIVLTLPANEKTKLPLLVYLPGLGESAQAGAHWRYAWARAGYAVLSLQALAADANAWSSDLARQADFKALALQHQQPALLPARLRILEGAIAEARLRAANGDGLWSRVDLDRVAVIGYDLGAATALAWAAASGPLANGQARALVLLSPSGLTPPDLPPKFPLLAINSRRAADLTGLLDSAAERSRFFEQLPLDANKYLLLLNSPSHAALAGAAGMAESPSEPSGRGGARRSMGNTPGGSQPNAVMREAPAPSSLDRGNQEAGVAAAHISIAFLDAHLRAKPAASSWLNQAAAGWLAGLAEWRLR